MKNFLLGMGPPFGVLQKEMLFQNTEVHVIKNMSMETWSLK